MGRDSIWGREMQFWGRETNWVHKSDMNIFVNVTKN